MLKTLGTSLLAAAFTLLLMGFAMALLWWATRWVE